MGARLLLLSRMLGRMHALLPAFHLWRGLSVGVPAAAQKVSSPSSAPYSVMSSVRSVTPPSTRPGSAVGVAVASSGGRVGGGGGGPNERRLVNEERRIVRMKAEVEGLKKRLEIERSEQNEAAAELLGAIVDHLRWRATGRSGDEVEAKEEL